QLAQRARGAAAGIGAGVGPTALPRALLARLAAHAQRVDARRADLLAHGLAAPGRGALAGGFLAPARLVGLRRAALGQDAPGFVLEVGGDAPAAGRHALLEADDELVLRQGAIAVEVKAAELGLGV